MTDVKVFISFDVLDATGIIPPWLNQHHTENVIDRRFLNIWWSHKLHRKSLLAVHNCLFTVILHIWEQCPSCASLKSFLDISLWRPETDAYDSGLCPVVVFNFLLYSQCQIDYISQIAVHGCDTGISNIVIWNDNANSGVSTTGFTLSLQFTWRSRNFLLWNKVESFS